MTLDLLPPKLATMEGVKRAVRAALDADLAAALAYVSTLAVRDGGPLLLLPPPKAIRMVTVRDYAAITAWPTLTIESEGLTGRAASEQGFASQVVGRLSVICWLQHQQGDVLDLLLDRYAAAVWIVLVNGEPFDRAEIERDSRDIAPDESGGTTNRRAVRVAVSLLMWGR